MFYFPDRPTRISIPANLRCIRSSAAYFSDRQQKWVAESVSLSNVYIILSMIMYYFIPPILS